MLGPLRAVLEGFTAATDLAASVLAAGAVEERWSEPSSVARFSIGGLAAHVYAGLQRLEVGLDETLPLEARVVGLADFYGANRIGDRADQASGLHAAIVDDAERRAAHGPAAVRERFGELVERLRGRLATEPADRSIPVLQVPGGVTPLATYLATRVVELVVHSDDLAVSVDLPDLTIPRPAASVVIDVCMELARARAGDGAVIRALTRAERASAAEDLRVL